MCGRFALHTPLAVLLEQFEALAPEPHELEPRYNVAPTQPVPAVRDVGAGRQLAVVRWGLVTPWSEGPDGKGPLLINARGETASERPSFRTALRRRRCLVPADGFYEWERIGRRRLPLYFSDPEERPLALGAIWERWARGDAPPLESCAILTTAANAVVAPYHDRMPVLVSPEDFDRWLDPTLQDPEAVRDLLAPPPDATLRARALEPWVNDIHHEGPRCLTERLTLFGA